jgi:hypothetical protein
MRNHCTHCAPFFDDEMVISGVNSRLKYTPPTTIAAHRPCDDETVAMVLAQIEAIPYTDSYSTHRAIVALWLFEGLSPNTIRWLLLGDVDLANNVLRIPSMRRFIPIRPELKGYLVAYLEDRVFLNTSHPNLFVPTYAGKSMSRTIIKNFLIPFGYHS